MFACVFVIRKGVDSMKSENDDRKLSRENVGSSRAWYFEILCDKRDFLPPLSPPSDPVSDRYVLSTFWITAAGYLDVAERTGKK